MNISSYQVYLAYVESGLTYRQLAKKLNDSSGNVHRTIKKMKNGGSVTTKTIEKYARILGLFDEKSDE